MENITCSNECEPYFLESRITFRFTKGDLLCSSIHDIPIISHVRYDSPADHLNITSGSIIYKINDSEEDFHCADCDTLFPTSSESVTISLRRLIPYRLSILDQSSLIFYHYHAITIELSTSQEYSGDFYLTEDAKIILINEGNQHVYSIRDASISVNCKYIQCNLVGGGYLRIRNYPNQRDFLHSVVYCFYRLLQIQQQALTQNSSFINPYNSTMLLFKGDIEFYEKRAFSSWKPRIVVVTDMGTIMVKSHSKVLLVLHLEDVFISNDYSKILKEKNTSTKDRVLWILARKISKRAKLTNEEKERKKDMTMLFRFADVKSLRLFYHCVHNISSEDQRAHHQLLSYSYSSLQRDSEVDSSKNDLILICKYAFYLREPHFESTEGESPEIQEWSPMVEKKGRELYEISMRIPAIMKNPQILTRFLYTLNSTGITLQIWDLIICQFFPLFADSNQGDLLFQILHDIHISKAVQQNEGNNKLTSLLREKYLQLSSSQRHRRYSLCESIDDWRNEVVSFDVFEEYIQFFHKAVERSLAKSMTLNNLFSKFKETIQFGTTNTIMNGLIISVCAVKETNTDTAGIAYLNERSVILIIANEMLIVPINGLQSCSTVNKSLHLVFNRFITLPETSHIRALFGLPHSGENNEKDFLLSLRFINKFLKKEDYSSLLFFTTAINELITYNASLKLQSKKLSMFSSSMNTTEHSNQLQYLLLNLFRTNTILQQTGTVATLSMKEVVIPAVQSFSSLFSKDHSPENEFEKFDLLLCKREIMLFFLLMNHISLVFKGLTSVAMFEVPGVSLIIFLSLTYIGLTNQMHWLFPFFVICCFVAWYYCYFDKLKADEVTLQEALETRQLEKRHLAGKGIKNKINSYMTSVNKFYSVVVNINTVLLKIRSLATWTDVKKTQTAMIIFLIVFAFFHFLPSNIVLILLTVFIFSKRWRNPDPPIRQYLRSFWNSIPLPAFSREQAALVELYNE